MTQGKIVEGVFAINKPQFIGSAQVLRELQTHFGRSTLFAPWIQAEKDRRDKERASQRGRRRDKGPVKVKIGHGGTLDPLATGVLIAGIGKGTKQLSGFLDCTKTYETVVLFGVATDTYDRLGKVIGRAPYQQLTRAKVEKALKRFQGKVMQRPPIFSALRIDGKRLYEYAREGKEVPREIKERPVGVEKLELIEWMDGDQHEYTWPTEEAEAHDKYVAEQILSIGDNKSASKEGTGEQTEKVQDRSSPRQQSPPTIEVRNFSTTTTMESSGPSKRKRDQDDSDDDLVFDAKHQRSRRKTSNSDIEPLMSGGLPSPSPAPTAHEASFSLINTTNNNNSPSNQPSPPAEASSPAPPANLIKPNEPSDSDSDSNPRSQSKPNRKSRSHSPSSPSSPPAARLRLTVSSGFYVRSLCHDLGMSLGSLGIMSELVRTRQAQFELAKGNVFDYADLWKGEEVWGPRIEGLLDDWWRERRSGPEGEIEDEEVGVEGG